MKELEFESELIQYITHGTITHSRNDVNSCEQLDDPDVSNYITKSKLWKYEPSIRTTDELWNNFKAILEQHNQSTLDRPDRKSTRLNSSHVSISYAVFCLKKK